MPEFKVADGVLTAHLEGEAVLLNMKSRNYHRLNGTAASIWKGLESGIPRATILERLCARYDVEIASASASHDELCDDLLLRGLIVPAPPAT